MILGITGHRGLSADVEREVRALLRAELAAYDAGELCGVSCLADGPDAWFAEAVLALGGRLEVVVPAEEYRAGLPVSHHATYDGLLARAAAVHRTGLRESTEEAHMRGSEILVGLADRLLAVWDGQPARGYGGTADVVAHARRTGVPVETVWPEGAVRD
ncbi:hypothetical protein [Streptomyces catenulae]|uniref:Uncharacterized protein n=1 Tax=Streptomyces catenulae TaxID=66875 RepID=A0ABV2Z274_9ACTN|nr:hypothetical protein [Streptomyces catenulae]